MIDGLMIVGGVVFALVFLFVLIPLCMGIAVKIFAWMEK